MDSMWNTDRENLPRLLDKLFKQYKGKIIKRSGRLTSVNLGTIANKFKIPISAETAWYGILIPGLEGAATEIDRRFLITGKYVQTDKGFIVPAALQNLIMDAYESYRPPKNVYVML